MLPLRILFSVLRRCRVVELPLIERHVQKTYFITGFRAWAETQFPSSLFHLVLKLARLSERHGAPPTTHGCQLETLGRIRPASRTREAQPSPSRGSFNRRANRRCCRRGRVAEARAGRTGREGTERAEGEGHGCLSLERGRVIKSPKEFRNASPVRCDDSSPSVILDYVRGESSLGQPFRNRSWLEATDPETPSTQSVSVVGISFRRHPCRPSLFSARRVRSMPIAVNQSWQQQQQQLLPDDKPQRTRCRKAENCALRTQRSKRAMHRRSDRDLAVARLLYPTTEAPFPTRTESEEARPS